MSDSAYRQWRTYSVQVAGKSYDVATKPGAFAHGRLDTGAQLLAEHVDVKEGDTVVQMNCGNGLLGAVASRAGHAGRVLLTDRNVVSVEATRRTLTANGAHNAQVLLGHGSYALPNDLQADSVAIRIPNERVAVIQLLAAAFALLKIGGRCYIAGATNEGIKTAVGMIETIFGTARVLARDSSHRVASAVKRSATPANTEQIDNPFVRNEAFNELDAVLRGTRYRLYSRPGVFSWDHVDEATMILADVMQVREGDAVLDIGCGCGALGIVAAALSGHGRLVMVDADIEAVRSATRSAEANRVVNYRALTSDIAGAVLDERFDVVVTNPPFHVGKATDLNVPMQFIQDAWDVLVHGGRLVLVANRTLPYEQAIRRRFGNVENLHDGPRFKVLTATREID